MNTFPLLLILVSVVWLWYDSLRYREHAIRGCKKDCKEMGLQLLDQTVALGSFSLRKDFNKRLKFMRRYNFEFSINGNDRYKGSIVLLGDNIEHTRLEHPDGTIIMHKN
jgi:hypothetical protein